MTTVWIVVINSTYFEDSLSHTAAVFSSYSKAIMYKQEYEKQVRENYGMVLPRIKTGTDTELDKYLEVQHEIEKAKKFLSCDIQEWMVQ